MNDELNDFQLINQNQNQIIETVPDIISENDFFKELTEIMEDEKFMKFFTKYMGSWLDIKSSVIYMKMYNEFKEKYESLNDEQLDKNLIVYLLTKVMRDRDLRPFTIKAMDDMLDGKKVKFFKEFEKILKSKNKLLKDK
tara:strand:- start:1037 stop:1453 length:417 start_codon:yes stop_codon:yes gene_type:complete